MKQKEKISLQRYSDCLQIPPTRKRVDEDKIVFCKIQRCSKKGYKKKQDGCHKEYADTFAIYPYSNYPEYKEIRKEYAHRRIFIYS